MIKILVKLPVKLGDTVMASSFLRALRAEYPTAHIVVIMAKGLEGLMDFMPFVDDMILFSKAAYPGPIGNYRFGKKVAQTKKFDLFFCLPFSFSSALAGFFTSSKKRIGHKTEHRCFLLTDSYALPANLHVVEDYMNLLDNYLGKKLAVVPPKYNLPTNVHFDVGSDNYLVLNVPSGPPSRYIPIQKSVEIIQAVIKEYDFDIVLTGTNKEKGYIEEIIKKAAADQRVINIAGKTTIPELGYVLNHAKIMITTDSGNAHFANALDTPSIILFGPGIQPRCHPYNKNIIRSLQRMEMECIECNSEHCKFGDSRCLTNIENADIMAAMRELLV